MCTASVSRLFSSRILTHSKEKGLQSEDIFCSLKSPSEIVPSTSLVFALRTPNLLWKVYILENVNTFNKY